MSAVRLIVAALCFSSLATAAQAAQWPMPVEDFLKGNYLETGDIVLTRREWNPTSLFIRWATDSQFSHTAMVFAAPPEPGYSSTWIIEAIATGIDITNLRAYIRERGSVIGVKRLRKPWFKFEHKARVRGLALEYIKADYNYGTLVKVGKEILFDVQKHWSGIDQAVASFRDKDWKPPNSLICSGLVQVGLVEAVTEFIQKGELPPWVLRDVVFDEKLKALLPTQEQIESDPTLVDKVVVPFRKVFANELEATTPEEIAANDSFEWRYLIIKGQVHRIDGPDQARQLMRGAQR